MEWMARRRSNPLLIVWFSVLGQPCSSEWNSLTIWRRIWRTSTGLSEAGVRHQRVVSAIAEVADILPARFGTVFLDASSLKADVRKRKKLLAADLRRIHGCDEWGVKVFAVTPKTEVANKEAHHRARLPQNQGGFAPAAFHWYRDGRLGGFFHGIARNISRDG